MQEIHPNEIGDEHILIDVRTPAEFRAEKISNSRNVPLAEFEQNLQSLSGHKNIVLVCATGNRAKKAQEILLEQKQDALVLDGGIKGWKSAERPIERSVGGIVSLERQVRIAAGSLVAMSSILSLTVDPYWALISAFVGCGLVFAGVTDTCGMGAMLAKLPYNRN